MRARFFLFASSAVFVGCNALLGIESASFDPPADAATIEGAADSSFTDGPGPRADARVEDVFTVDADAMNDVSAPDVVEAGGDADADAATDGDAATCTQDCLGGACAGGQCQPFTVIDLGAQDPNGLTAAGTDVYWTNATKRQLQTSNGVANTPVSVVLTLADTNAFNSGEISSDATHVYFAEEDATDDASITYRVERVGQTERNVTTAETILDALPTAPTDVIAEGPNNVVWNEFAAGRILHCASVPCGVLDVAATGEELPSHLRTRGGRIAWATLNTKLVRLRPTGGGMATTLATAQNLVGTVLLLKNVALYSDLNVGFIAHDFPFPPTGERPLSDAKNVTQSALDPDGVTVWFTSSGALMRVPAAGGTVQLVATGLGAPRALSVNTRGVYWLDTSGARRKVMGVAK